MLKITYSAMSTSCYANVYVTRLVHNVDNTRCPASTNVKCNGSVIHNAFNVISEFAVYYEQIHEDKLLLWHNVLATPALQQLCYCTDFILAKALV